MGVFSGLLTFGVAYWFLQTVSTLNETASEQDKKNGWRWFWIGGASYFAGFLVGMALDRAVVFGLGGMDIGVGSGFLGEGSGGDTGFLGVFLELIPLVFGFVVAYLVRRRFLLNKKFDFSALKSRFSTK
jgi:hypothetical protein